MKTRKVILHYHLFKNAGTSLDASLKLYFSKGKWLTQEFSSNRERNSNDLRLWMKNSSEAECFSSHTAFLPVPEYEYMDVFPVIFLRHPIDRIVSAYKFEAKQNAETYGSILARNTNIGGYIETRLAQENDRQCRNFHSHRLSMMFSESEGTELERSLRAVEESPFIGIVEKFSDSIRKLESDLSDFGFRDIRLSSQRKNVTQSNSDSIAEKMAMLEGVLGVSLFDKLLKANEIDLQVYAKACSLLK